MADDQLPSEFDLIVIGTGRKRSIDFIELFVLINILFCVQE